MPELSQCRLLFNMIEASDNNLVKRERIYRKGKEKEVADTKELIALANVK